MRFTAIAVSFALAACALTPGAEAPAPFTSAPTPAVAAPEAYDVAVDLPAGRYQLDRRHASVLFRIRHMELSWFTARFDTIDAALQLDAADPSRSQVTASVDAGAVNTSVVGANGARGFDEQIGRALGGAAIGFESTAIERTGRNTARVIGNLTMNGQTHPATLETTFGGGRIDPLRGGAMVLGFSAHGTIDRTQWGVNDWRAFTGDEVQIVIEAEFVRG